MNDDYLWDRTGEPDPEIQKFETILGELRYQPRPLEIPADAGVGRKQGFFRDFGPRLAIAATIAMLVVGLGVWFAAQRLRNKESNVLVLAPKTNAVTPDVTPAVAPTANANQDTGADSKEPSDQKRIEGQRRPRANREILARNPNRLRNTADKNQQLTAEEREGEAAKNQLMMALRLASTKLSFAQKKTQGATPRELIHNQHKIG